MFYKELTLLFSQVIFFDLHHFYFTEPKTRQVPPLDKETNGSPIPLLNLIQCPLRFPHLFKYWALVPHLPYKPVSNSYTKDSTFPLHSYHSLIYWLEGPRGGGGFCLKGGSCDASRKLFILVSLRRMEPHTSRGHRLLSRIGACGNGSRLH